MKGQVLAPLHFVVTELRPFWLLWYTTFNTIESIVTNSLTLDLLSSRAVAGCLEAKTITINGIESCAKAAYDRYLPRGPSEGDETCVGCSDARIGVLAPEPRIMLFLMTVWLFGLLFVLFLYCLYCRPDYNNGTYIKFTQSLYSTIVYRILAYITFVLSLVMIFAGMYLLMKYGYDWTSHVLTLILIVVECRKLLELKHDGFDITSHKFGQLPISRGSSLMKPVNFLGKTNAKVLDEMEVQVMRKVLPETVAAKEEQGCLSCFALHPLNEGNVKSLQYDTDGNSNSV